MFRSLTSLFALSLTLSSVAFSAERAQLVTVTSDAVDNGKTALYVKGTLDSDANLTNMVFVKPQGEQVFSLSQLPTGMVLLNVSGKNVVTMYSQNFSSEHGGTITLKYLYNGLTGSTKSFSFYLSRDKSQNSTSQWFLERDTNAGRQRFTQIYAQSKKVLGQTVGIETLIVK